MGEKCHKELETRSLNRPSRYDHGLETPLCGRNKDHKGQHLSEEVMETARKRVKEWKRAAESR